MCLDEKLTAGPVATITFLHDRVIAACPYISWVVLPLVVPTVVFIEIPVIVFIEVITRRRDVIPRWADLQSVLCLD